MRKETQTLTKIELIFGSLAITCIIWALAYVIVLLILEVSLKTLFVILWVVVPMCLTWAIYILIGISNNEIV